MCAAYRDAADAEFERIHEQISVNLALSNDLQEEVNQLRELHGSVVVSQTAHNSDENFDPWDSAAEASSTVGAAPSSSSGETADDTTHVSETVYSVASSSGSRIY